MASWTNPALDDEHIGWARETAAAIEPWSVSGGYANYMQADEPLERVRAAFGAESFDRLRVVKSRYVPAGCAVRIARDRRGAGWIRARRKGAAWFGC
jgi:Berberine and berberine like